MNKDPNYVAALERAISEKYGDLAVANPKSMWDENKEKQYNEQVKEKIKIEAKNEQSQEHIDLNGVLISKKLINNNNKRNCEYCNRYSFNRNDDLFFTKFETCYSCYIKHVEGREEKWKQGWRPDKVTEQK